MNDNEFQKLLHEQENWEIIHALTYLDFANWALAHKMLGFYCTFKKQAMAEMGDAKEIAWYSVGTEKLKPVINIQFVSPNYSNILEIGEKIVAMETDNLKRLNVLADELRGRGNLIFYNEIKEYALEQKHEIEDYKVMLENIKSTGLDETRLKALDDEMYSAYQREKGY